MVDGTQIPPEEAELRARARLLTERHAALGSMLKWVPYNTPGYSAPEHFAPLCEDLDAVIRGEARYIIFEAPPRHGKTDLIFSFVARYLLAHPDKLVAYCSYSADFAQDKSKECVKFASRGGVKFVAEREEKDPIDPSMSSRYWQTSKGGGFIAVGRRGALKGRGVDLVIVDDPFKDRQEAESPTVQSQVWAWWTGTAFDRIEPGGSAIIMHQRWNDKDLIARIIEQWEDSKERKRAHRPWCRQNFPAINEKGEALWPERRGVEDLAEIRTEVGEYNWWSQFMQDPKALRAGMYWKRAWVEVVEKAPEFAHKVRFWDFAAMDPAKSKAPDDPDWVVGALLSCHYWQEVPGKRVMAPVGPFYVEHIDRFRGTPLEIEQRIRNTCLSDRAACKGFYLVGMEQEPGSSELTVLNWQRFMQEFNFVLRFRRPKGSKVERFGAYSGRAQGGAVKLKAAGWNSEYHDELEAFPTKGVHDDQCDASSGAYDFMVRDDPDGSDGPGMPSFVWSFHASQGQVERRPLPTAR